MFLKSKKKNHGWHRKVCSPHGPHIPVSRGFSKEHRKMGGVFCRDLFCQVSTSYLILGRKRFKSYMGGVVWKYMGLRQRPICKDKNEITNSLCCDVKRGSVRNERRYSTENEVTMGSGRVSCRGEIYLYHQRKTSEKITTNKEPHTTSFGGGTVTSWQPECFSGEPRPTPG
jgi:hypothetical protein